LLKLHHSNCSHPTPSTPTNTRPQTLSDSVSELQRLAARGDGGSNKQAAEHTSSVVESLRGRLKDLTSEFKEV